MAVITDATGRQLVNSIGGIDTAGLAKDTTLQATNTAIGNVASAINNIANDKANISGDNITDKETFRQNIGIGCALINTYTSNGQTLYHNLSNYSKILIVGYFTNTSNVTYVIGSLLIPTAEIINNYGIVCLNDGTLRKGQLRFTSTYASTETFSNITVIKVFGIN